MITVSMSRSASRALDVRSRNNDSGVVIHTSGGFFACRVRSDWGVSPVLMPTEMGGIVTPERAAICSRPIKGLRRLRSMSEARALSGETYSTRLRSAGGVCASESNAARNAARVLPEPVGAIRTAS